MISKTAFSIKRSVLIKIDKTSKHEINAGQCQYCGNYKTWDFKVLNKKTGKWIPGHVTKEGFKINDGYCPFFSLIKSRNKEHQEEKKFHLQEKMKMFNQNSMKTKNQNKMAEATCLIRKRISVIKNKKVIVLLVPGKERFKIYLSFPEATTLSANIINKILSP
ncbi:MAG: hypothetical protein ACTSVI_10680 [Promethearchaeota archaeon]